MEEEHTKKEINDLFKKIKKFNKCIENEGNNKFSVIDTTEEERIWVVADSSSSFNNIKEFANG
ncbi:MAG: hypothetical protein WC227_02895 [Patescibacteria group bacterium]|jgi:hypothetical protein